MGHYTEVDTKMDTALNETSKHAERLVEEFPIENRFNVYSDHCAE